MMTNKDYLELFVRILMVAKDLTIEAKVVNGMVVIRLPRYRITFEGPQTMTVELISNIRETCKLIPETVEPFDTNVLKLAQAMQDAIIQ